MTPPSASPPLGDRPPHASWGLIVPLLAHEDATVNVFCTHTAHANIARRKFAALTQEHQLPLWDAEGCLNGNGDDLCSSVLPVPDVVRLVHRSSPFPVADSVFAYKSAQRRLLGTALLHVVQFLRPRQQAPLSREIPTRHGFYDDLDHRGAPSHGRVLREPHLGWYPDLPDDDYRR
ncbi:hypothetical protein C8R44DRAFT_991409 [Mycena epipterygia]|nr:hypothetical protein C8R44DRAFT_991409 [Mycena epipterygia]